MGSGSRGKGRGRPGVEGLSPADRLLWQRVTESAKPLTKDRLSRQAEADEGTAAPRPARRQTLPRAEAVPLAPRRPPEPELATGQAPGVAHRQLERLRRGLLPIEARLDLHGHRQEEAERELADFLVRAQAAGKRCVLVVTGRGVGKTERGVLRRMVPIWLNQPPNRGRLLAFAQAQPKHGGAGALYLLLKRRRDG